MTTQDVTVVGSGPNGLAAAVVLARAGLSVRVIEANDHLGGGAATRELTLPGFLHDVCSAVHPSALVSQFFRRFELTRRVEFIVPEASYAHPLDDRPAGVAYRDLDRTCAELGEDGTAWRRLIGPLADHADGLADLTGGALLRVPKDLVGSAWYAARVAEVAGPLRTARFTGPVAPAMVAGCVAHSVASPVSLAAAGAGLKLATEAHVDGWPIPRGGSQAITDAMVRDLQEHGATFETGRRVESLDEVDSRVTVLDTSIPRFLTMAGDRLPGGYAALLRTFRAGHAVAKVDLALSEPIPWRDPRVAASPTVHLGGTWQEIHAAERRVQAGHHPENPYVLVCQPTPADPSRAPRGRHVLWAYTHVPSGSDRDMLEPILDQIERFAPGARDTVLAASSRTARELAAGNENYLGGDILGGALSMRQLVARPAPTPAPWRTPLPGVYLASASTPPGPAVHGLCGMHAARHALADVFGITAPPYLGLASSRVA